MTIRSSPRSPSNAARISVVVAYALVAIAPVVVLAAYSVFEKDGFEFRPSLQTTAFSDALGNTDTRALLVKTLFVMFIAATMSTVLAYAVVFCAVVVVPRLRRIVMMFALLALFGGYLVRIFAWRTLLGREGLVASIAGGAGPFGWVGDLANTRWAVLLALVNFSVPLCILPISAAFSGMDPRLPGASRDLGANGVATFRRVILPQTLRGATLAFALAFVLSAGDYVTPALLGGRDGFMFGSVIAQQFTMTANWPLGAALALILMASVSVVIALVFLLASLAARLLSGTTSDATATGVVSP